MAAEQKPVQHPVHEDIQDFECTPHAAHFSYGGPETARVEISAPAEREATPDAAKPVAMLVCHGMGQQVRFETLGQVASSILTAAEKKGCTPDPNGVHLTRSDDSFLARAELKWSTPEGDKREVHLYEAYWAPVTESKVSYADTIQFLFQAAWRGFRCSRFMRASTFDRWMFGDMRRVAITAGTQLSLILVALLLAFEVGAIAFVGFRVAAGVKELSSIVWPRMPGLHGPVSSIVYAVVLFCLRCCAEILKPFLPEHAGLFHPASIGAWLGAAWRTVVWLALIAQAFFVRYFLIQYVGDVAAYISPFKDSKFDSIRTQIQQIGLKIGRVIYGFTGVPGVPDYHRVVVVGHSLGSVLAYDTLNALINADLVSASHERRDVQRRTSHLITFGSPLDKTAFLFRTQSNHAKDPLREQLAAGFQPLILDYGFRQNLTWINLWAPKDIISGSLDYYDLPGNPLCVRNIQDPAGTVPFKAHVQYWGGEALAGILYDAVC